MEFTIWFDSFEPDEEVIAECVYELGYDHSLYGVKNGKHYIVIDYEGDSINRSILRVLEDIVKSGLNIRVTSIEVSK